MLMPKALFSWLVPIAVLALSPPAGAQDWAPFAVPAQPGPDKDWVIDQALSDQFNYASDTPAGQVEFYGKWNDWKPDHWFGPGATYFSTDNYSVAQGLLTIFASRIPLAEQIPSGDAGFTRTIYTSYITSKAKLQPGIYTEIMMKGGATQLSANFWMIDDNNETEIDVVEIYGDGDWFPRHPATNVHFQRRGGNGDVNNQAHHAKDAVNYSTTWHRYGVYWISPTHLEFYYDGQRVRTLDLTQEIVDPSGQYMDSPVRLIIDLEAHAWRGTEALPSDAELSDQSVNNMQVDWVRTYRSVDKKMGLNGPIDTEE
ncbi:MAG: family 16 glycosylhydrolase [Candidatus Latescibacteria bacterium]|nr:family 16 glycosylhydrolase [Candidatus Latescibacterota bacterium]